MTCVHAEAVDYEGLMSEINAGLRELLSSTLSNAETSHMLLFLNLEVIVANKEENPR